MDRDLPPVVYDQINFFVASLTPIQINALSLIFEKVAEAESKFSAKPQVFNELESALQIVKALRGYPQRKEVLVER